MSRPTAKRKLIYFLVHLRVLSPLIAATYMVNAELKSMSLYELQLEIEEELKNTP